MTLTMPAGWTRKGWPGRGCDKAPFREGWSGKASCGIASSCWSDWATLEWTEVSRGEEARRRNSVPQKDQPATEGISLHNKNSFYTSHFLQCLNTTSWCGIHCCPFPLNHKKFRTIPLHVLYGCEPWSFNVGEHIHWGCSWTTCCMDQIQLNQQKDKMTWWEPPHIVFFTK